MQRKSRFAAKDTIVVTTNELRICRTSKKNLRICHTLTNNNLAASNLSDIFRNQRGYKYAFKK